MLFLNPHDKSVLSTEQEQRHYDKVSYRGKRTGRPCVASSQQPQPQRHPFTPHTTTSSDTSSFHKLYQKYRWIVADALHIIRPYYWTLACRNYHHHHPSPLVSRRLSSPHSIDSPDQHPNTSPSSTMTAVSLWKAYVCSFAMDSLSQILTSAGAPIVSSSTRHEIQRRKRRLWLYLLRTPLWDTATFPLLSQFIRLVQSSTYPKVLWRFLLQPIVHYVMDTLQYYQSHHFMLE